MRDICAWMYFRVIHLNIWGYKVLEFFILDKNFKEIGTLSAFDSVIWTRRYYEPGEFEFYTNKEYWAILEQGRYICRADNTDTAIIEHIGREEENDRIFAKGRFIEALLGNCVIHTQTTFSGTNEVVVRKMIQDYAIGKIQKLELGGVNGIGGNMEVQCTGDNVMDKAYETAKAVEASIKVIYDYVMDTMRAEVWCGKNRTEGQSINTLAVFSDDEGSAEMPEYDFDTTDYRNFAYIAGEDSGQNRIIITIDMRQNSSEELREVWIDARDLQMKEGMTIDVYKGLLKQRGLEKMTEYQKVETVEVVEGNNNALIYRKNYDVGDVCTYRNEAMGLELEARITECIEMYENNENTLDLIFGTQKITKIKRIEKGVI